MENNWNKYLSQRSGRIQSSTIRELLKISNLPGVISFAGGLPSPDVFPIEPFIEASEKVLRENGSQALQYGTTEGFLPLRELISYISKKSGIIAEPDNILITNGSQQALDLIGKVFIDPGDKVIVENPTYLGALQAWKVYGAEFITVEMDEYGMIPESLENVVDQNPKMIYLLPNFQNPAGCTLTAERRIKIIEIARKYQIPIIEDDPYGQLRYEGDHLPPVIVTDAEQSATENDRYVIYLSTFSKILAPGLRLAWVIAPKSIILKLVQAKQGSDLHTSTFVQMLAHEVCKDDFLEKHIPFIKSVYRNRRDLMMDLIDEHFPDRSHYVRPLGGLFLFVTTPPELNTEMLLPEAVKQKVAFVPGTPFYANGGGHNTMRLNFSNASENDLRIGMERLGNVLKEAMVYTN